MTAILCWTAKNSLRGTPLKRDFTAGVYLAAAQNFICVYSTLIYSGKGGERCLEKVKGTPVHKAGSKIPTLLTVFPVYKL